MEGLSGGAGNTHVPVNKTAQWASLCIRHLLACRRSHSVLSSSAYEPKGAEKFGSLPQVITISSKAGTQIQSATSRVTINPYLPSSVLRSTVPTS